MPDQPSVPPEQPVEPPNVSLQPEAKPSTPGVKRRKKLLIIGIVLLVAVVVGAALALFADRSQQSSPQPSASPSPSPQAQKSLDNDVPNTTKLKTFTSDPLGLQINHPADWTTAEKEGGLQVVSPEFTYQSWDKGDVTGYFRVYIRKGARDMDGKHIGRGVVIEPSEKLVYAQPGTGQRKDTNFTRFGSLTSDHFTFFMVTGDFQLKKDDQLGPNYGKEPDTYIIVGGFSSKAQTEDLDFSNISLDQYAQKRAYTQAVEIIRSLKLQ